MRRLIPSLVLLSLAACGPDRAPPPGPDADLLVASDSGVALGGERLAGAPADALVKIEPLHAKLIERREAWERAHPDEKYAGQLTVDLGPTLTCRAAMSLYMTAARAGVPRLRVKQGPIALDLPYFTPQWEMPCDVPVRELDAVFLANGDVELRLNECGGAYDVGQAASLPSIVKELCSLRGEGKCFDGLQIACDEGVPAAGVLRALAELERTYRPMSLGLAESCAPGERSPFRAPLPAPETPPAAPPGPPAASAAGKKRQAAQVRLGDVSATGGLAVEEVEAVLKPRLADIRACYEAGLDRNPELRGRVVVKLSVGKKGAVMTASNGGSELTDGGVVSCAVRSLRGVSFPGKGATGVVTCPLELSPGPGK